MNAEDVTIDDLIKQVKDFIKFKGSVRFDLPAYEKFHSGIQDFVCQNHFQNTPEWQIISKNLVYKSTQFMTESEANTILINLNSLRMRVLECENEEFWQYMHPEIIRVSKQLFKNGSYANATTDAFIEINGRVKKLYSTISPDADSIPDGCALMTTVFSNNKPMLEICDRSDDSGKNTQLGYMNMLSGAMSALRNPKAHENIVITREDAVRRLLFASMLMYKIDEAVAYSKVKEG